ncbi:hypothetical protein CPB97_008683 [Podila verticillata]|nr:hypothetical protein CPB97_008683 [Podila verticillata]
MMCVTEYCTTAKNIGLQWLPIPFKKLLMDYYHVANRKQTTKLPWFLEGDSLSAPFPSYVIGSGAKALPGLLHVSRMSGKASYSAHIHFPALPFIHFDQVFLQRHEIAVQLAALGLMKDQKNYFRLNSTLNAITPKSLRQAKHALQDSGFIPNSFFASSSEPSAIVTVLIGGPNEDCSHNTDRMVNRLNRLLEAQDARVLISYSQRTASNTKAALIDLKKSLRNPDRLFIYDPMPRNDVRALVAPTISNADVYEGMLALADKIVVTADSVAMTNEALSTGKPVYILGGEMARGKLKVFHRYLADNRYTRAFRPGRVMITPIKEISSSEPMNDRADPLSYPGDHPPWNCSLAFQGPVESKKIADRLKILRDCRIAGRRAPPEVADATS